MAFNQHLKRDVNVSALSLEFRWYGAIYMYITLLLREIAKKL